MCGASAASPGRWAAVFAAFAGLSFCLMFSLEPEISQMGLRGFPATILGGLDSVVGGAFGGLIIGVAENLAGGYLGRGLKEIAGFVPDRGGADGAALWPVRPTRD